MKGDQFVKRSLLRHSRLRGNDGMRTIWVFTNPSNVTSSLFYYNTKTACLK